MRALYYLTIIAFLLACASCFLLWETLLPHAGGDSILTSVERMKHSFQQKSEPVSVFNLNSFLQQQSRSSSELIDPKLTLPQTSRYPYSEFQVLQSYSRSCGLLTRINFHDAALKKALIWAKYRCGVIPALPPTFFIFKPLMHPSGKSYAWLAYESAHPEFNSPNKLFRRKGLFHLSELLSLKEFQSPVLNLSPWQLQLLINGENQVINEDFVFFLSPSRSTNRNSVYSLYPTNSWMKYLARQKYTILYGARTQPCLLKEGNTCWVENPNYRTFNFRLTASLLLAAFLVWSVIPLFLLVRRVRTQKQETAQRLFTLQMLTHELRTPTASMRLSIEAFRKNYDELPQQSQKAFLQMCEELQRLDRLVDASKNYLSDDETRSEVHLNEFVNTIVRSYEIPVSFMPLSSELTLKLNAYWLELCIRNLIDNALNHGSRPVNVILTRDARHVSIQVQDQGIPLLTSLKEMTTPFCKAQTSRGLGLGLAIVRKLIKSMNGELIFQLDPTRFIIRLRSK